MTETGTARLEAVEVQRLDVPVTVYNVHVDNNHNYYTVIRDVCVLVHNADHVKALDVRKFSQLRSRERVGDGLEHDHIPSSAALKRAKEKELGRKLDKEEKRAVHDEGIAIEVPYDAHKLGDTFRGRNTQTRIESDASDLKAAAERDCANTRANMIEAGYAPDKAAAGYRNGST